MGSVTRKALSKKRRFEIFKRDLFVCQYCGQKPPAVVLEVDHIVAVAEGGSDEDHNLITACFDCNRGKGANPLAAIQMDVGQRAEIAKERAEQVLAYEDLLKQERQNRHDAVEEVVEVYQSAFEGWTLTDAARRSVDDFLRKLSRSEVLDAMEMAVARKGRDVAFRYFCGICWRKIKGN